MMYHIRYDMIFLLTAIGLTPTASSTVHMYTQNNTIIKNNTFGERTTQLTTKQHN